MEKIEVYQNSLFDDCASKCEAYASCGGCRSTAPCGCAWPYGHEKYQQCHKCYIICRERGVFNPNPQLLSKDFATEIESGYMLEQVQLNQEQYNLPIYIPTYTNKYRCKKAFSDFVAVDIQKLFNCRKGKGATLKPIFKTETDVRRHFNVTPECLLIVILNGQDWKLESFWAASRKAILEKLVSIGFTICTAPTFSVTALTTMGTPVPYSHHTAMLMRHHRVLSEISSVGLCGIPNLYWLDGDNKEIKRWANWLNNNAQIHLVSKDLTSTRDWNTIEFKISELISLLGKTDRFFHVLIIGTGAKNARKVVRKLTEVGHTVSIVTSAPVLKAIHGSKYFIGNNGELSDVSCPKSECSFSTLIEYNSELFENDLKNAIHVKL